ncbi:hypothetical protein HanPSC8_Chr16g0718661 [Helianthus annuus]|nr:hypothetical protein HanPSC8_Chr16g0718651 [Helianthus annuus]KAJ0821319.1 hypothetical protein HanPSC8_Chr16g0718661 [Helianthus annuus]
MAGVVVVLVSGFGSGCFSFGFGIFCFSPVRRSRWKQTASPCLGYSLLFVLLDFSNLYSCVITRNRNATND